MLAIFASVLELINLYCTSLFIPHVSRHRFFSNLPSFESKIAVTSRHHLPGLSARVRVPAFLGSHNWISPGKSEPGVRYQWYTTNAVVPSHFPPCLLSPFHPCTNQGLDAGAYFPSPLFSRLHDLAGLSFSPSLVHFPIPVLLNRLHPPNYCFLFCRFRRRRRRFVTRRLYLSLLFRSTLCNATFALPVYWQRQLPFIPQIERTSYSQFSRSFGHPWLFRTEADKQVLVTTWISTRLNL